MPGASASTGSPAKDSQVVTWTPSGVSSKRHSWTPSDHRSRAVDFRRDRCHGCSLRALDLAAAAVTFLDASTIAE